MRSAAERFLLSLRVDLLGDLVLLAGRANEGDEEGCLLLAGDALLEHLNQFGDGNALLWNCGLDFFESRQGEGIGRASTRSRWGAGGSAVARRAGLGLEAKFLRWAGSA